MKKILYLSVLFLLATNFSFALSLSIDQTDTFDNTTNLCVSLNNNMTIGSRDAKTNGEVTDLQEYLGRDGYLDLDPTGYFGKSTKKAVQSFQKANGITPNGLVGPITRAKIKSLSCGGVTNSSLIETFSANLKSPSSSQFVVSFYARLNGGIRDNATYEIEFGDGTRGNMEWNNAKGAENSNSLGVFHQYSSVGTYVAKLRQIGGVTVSNCMETDCNLVASVLVTIPARSDDISFSASPESGDAPLTVKFSSNKGTKIDFGDGSSEEFSYCLATGCQTEGFTVIHTYNKVGTYNVKVLGSCIGDSFTCSALPNGGRPVIQTLTVNVTQHLDSQTKNKVEFSANPESGNTPLTVTFNVSNSTTGDMIIDFGDGTKSNDYSNPTSWMADTCVSGYSCVPTMSMQHKYSTAGTYIVKLLGSCVGDSFACSALPNGGRPVIASIGINVNANNINAGPETSSVSTQIQRNSIRNAYIKEIAESLKQYRNKTGKFPSANGMWACVSNSCYGDWSRYYSVPEVDGALLTSFNKHSDPSDTTRGLGGFLYGDPKTYNGDYILHWVLEGKNVTDCGAGYYVTTGGNYSACILKIGDASGNISDSQNRPSVLGVNTHCADLKANLHRGNESSAVLQLQKFLVSKGLLSQEPTAFYGDSTIFAVKAYQRSVGLPETGMVYEFTRENIRKESCGM